MSVLFGNHYGSKPNNSPGISDGEVIFYTLPDIDDVSTVNPEVNQDRRSYYMPNVKR